MDTDQSAVRALIEAERQANLAGDVDALMALRAHDFTAMPPGIPPVHGTDNVRDFIAQSVQEGRVTEFRLTTQDRRIDGGLAVARVTGEGSMELAAAGDLNAPLTFLFVGRRQDDGGWLWLYCAWNVFPSA